MYAQTINGQELLRQQEAVQEAQRQAREIKPNVNQSAEADKKATISKWQAFVPQQTQETPCFWIQTIEWKGNELFDWLTIQAMPILRKCIGIQTIKALQDHLGQSLIDAGYITSRVLIPEQSLNSGVLRIDVVPGVISAKTFKGQQIGKLSYALPSNQAQLLNQRDIDQAIENVRRLPSQDEFAIDIAPGKNHGESELQVKASAQPKRWRANVSLDNTGSQTTGNKYQLGGNFSYDSPLGRYDSVNVNLGTNSNFGVRNRNNLARGLQWNIPYGYSMFSLGASTNRYKQTVAGFAGDIVYSGNSVSLDAGLQYVFQRDASQKNSVSAKIIRKTSKSYIDDTIVAVQSKDTVGYELTYNHRNNLNSSTLDIMLGFKGNSAYYSNNPGFIVGQPNWKGETLIQIGQVTWSTPFVWGEGLTQKGRYQTQLKWQQAYSAISSSEYFSLGGRYSIRGTDGSMSLAAESGLLVRSDVTWNIPNTNSQFYLAHDFGKVFGPNAASLLGDALSGLAVGLKGNYQGLNYDVTFGLMGSHPKGFAGSRHAAYGQMSYDF